MNPRTTGLLALVALVLGAFVYFYEIEGEEGRESERAAEKRLFAGLDAGSIEALELTTTDGIAARFARSEGGWRVLVPIEGPGDAIALDAIASALADLARVGSVASASADLGQFGLGPDARVVRFRATGADHALAIGGATPVGGNVYVRGDESAEVAFVERFRLNALEHGLTELRDRRIVRLASEALSQLEIAWPEDDETTSVVLERDASDVWQIREPIAVRADQQTVRELISNLEFLQATGFVDERSEAVEAALAETALELRLVERTTETPEDTDAKADVQVDVPADAHAGAQTAAPPATAKPTRSLRVAGLFEGSRIVESEGRLYRLAPERLEDFARRRDAYRDRQLVDLAPGALTRLELAFPGASAIVLSRGDAGWSAEGREIEADAVSGLADQLTTLRAEQIVADAMGESELASVGLAPAAVELTLGTAADGEAAIALELGRLDPERGLFARRTGETVVYALAASLAETLPLDLAAFDERYGRRPEPDSTPPEPADPLDQ